MHPLSQLELGELARGQLRLWWQGQLSYAIRGAGATVLIDPFLTPLERRLVPPAFGLDDLRALDIIAITHEHSDHFDPEFVRAAMERYPELVVVLPAPIADEFRSSTIDPVRVLSARPGQALTLGKVTIHPIPTVHGVNTTDAYSYGRELSDGYVRYLGYVVEFDGVSVFHSGDALVSDEQLAALLLLSPDVAILPINGRGYFREQHNLVGNMDHREAAQLAEVLGVDLLIPGHYDMFHDNRGYPGHLVDVVDREHPSLTVAVLSKQRPFNYIASGR